MKSTIKFRCNGFVRIVHNKNNIGSKEYRARNVEENMKNFICI
jgi:hypothetical protein